MGDTERQGLPGNTSLYRLKGLAETRIRICINKLKKHRTRPYKVRRGKNSLTPGFTMEEQMRRSQYASKWLLYSKFEKLVCISVRMYMKSGLGHGVNMND
ncbi:hypothetical protein TNCT_571331 [Trichonephila clavata]|uniref:Uncharacterized protein n=1 Tax=Trichonephila clavata TaxID=2740835 RepID=A0A8X6M1I8_TRICU|nr:hypothetical protein TNCT_571331 [Trichonephila clavata]